ncbi:MAG: MBL fold metallo-hydrolase [Lachnospiraceae bacterium]|nr:MBL fold metallo-hydrolase [Lachnospiraceae bacterium]
MRITVLGARGSIPVSGTEKSEFGQATSCYMVEAGKQLIFLDAGSGITDMPDVFQTESRPVSVFLSHVHLDHIQGLPFFPMLKKKEQNINIYLPAHLERAQESASLAEMLERVFSPPIWPCTLMDYPAHVHMAAPVFPMQLGEEGDETVIEVMDGSHPNGSFIYKLRHGGKTLVYATDFEHTEGKLEQLAGFAEDTDLLLYDGQYTDEEYEKHKGYGHSTPWVGVRLMQACGAKRLLLIHHDPAHDDNMLRAAEREIGLSEVSFARRMQEIEL